MNWPLISCGVVCPGGMGAAALSEAWTSALTHQADGTREHETFLVNREAPELKRWQKEPRLRRASPISYYMVEAAEQALSAAPHLDRQRTGVVAALFLGCLVYTVRFYRQLTKDGRRFASPLLFPETVFNSPLSHVVSTLRLGGPVYSQVGDTSCWANALRTAHCWLAKGRVDHVLVLGAEEFEPHELDAFQAGGLFRQHQPIAEGAGAVLLGREGNGVRMAALSDGHAFHSRTEAVAAATRCLAEIPGDDPVLPCATGWTKTIEAQALKSRSIHAVSPPNPVLAGTASCAWDTIFAADQLTKSGAPRRMLVPYFGHTQQCGAVWLERS